MNSIERAREEIANMAQYVDNPSEELEQMANELSNKLEFV